MAITQAEKDIYAVVFGLSQDIRKAMDAVNSYRSNLQEARTPHSPNTNPRWNHANRMLLEFAEDSQTPAACPRCGSLMLRMEDGSCRNCGTKLAVSEELKRD